MQVEEFPKHLEESINSIIQKKGYLTYNVDKKLISTEGGNYLGILYAVDVKGKTIDGDKETNMFVKCAIPNPQIDVFSIYDVYMNEMFVYTQLSKVFEELQNRAGVPEEERYNMVNGFDESNSEAIILENAAKKGYKTLNRMDVMPLKFAELSIEELAKFHALSFVMEEKQPKYFESKVKSIKHSFVFSDEIKTYFRKVCKVLHEYLDSSTQKKLEIAMDNLLEKVPGYINDTDSSKKCLCHGDYRPNNILMKEIEGEITSVIPVDYQLIYYGCPVLDFIYFIFLGTDQNFRRNHLEYLKDLYYETLRKFLRYFDMDVDSVYPRKEFETMYKERLDFGIMMFIQLLPFIFAVEDDVPDLGKQSIVDLNLKLDPKFEERMHGTFNDFIEWGYM